jgi:enoyl-CoA hydratase/carnithine racemase
VTDAAASRHRVNVDFRGPVAVITLDRPPVNAIDLAMISALHAAVDEVRAAAPSAVVIGSSSRVFSAGADLKEVLDDASRAVRPAKWRRFLHTVAEVEVPVVAAITGPCVGGGVGLITQCDLRLAAPGATFSFPEIKVGRAGGATHARRLLSEGRVRWMMLTGATVDAQTALGWGLVDEITGATPGGCVDAAVRLAGDIARNGREVVTLMKRSLDLSEQAGPVTGYEVEQEFTAQLRDAGLAVDRHAPDQKRADADGY